MFEPATLTASPAATVRSRDADGPLFTCPLIVAPALDGAPELLPDGDGETGETFDFPQAVTAASAKTATVNATW
jgi:hypothetical protein